jgi:hypothetical protein
MAGIIFRDEKFKRDLMAWSAKSKIVIADAVNNFIGDVALTASSEAYTKQASYGAIDQLGSRVEKQTGTYRKAFAESGKPMRVRVKTGSKWATSPDVGTFKLANWIMKNQGLPPLGNKKQGIPGRGFGGKMQKTGSSGTIYRISRNLIAARRLSVGFIRKGWWAAANAVGKKVERADPVAISRFGGGQKVVENAGTFRASIYNNAGSYDIRYSPERPRSPSGAKKIGEEGLTRAVNDNIQRFYKFMQSRLRKEWKNPTQG